jgi:dynein heavy chain 2
MQVVFEAPPGLKQNIQRTYAFWSSDFLAGHVASATARRSSSDDHGGARTSGAVRPTPAGLVPLRAQMLFLLAWFNAVLQERQNYVPIVSFGLKCITQFCMHCTYVVEAHESHACNKAV